MRERKGVVVTGASGFVGLNVVEALNAEGHETRAYVRASSNVSYLASLAAQLHTGEPGDGARLRKAMKGADAVIHCGAASDCYSGDASRLREANVDCTKAVIDAAIDSGVRRFVYTSTTATIGAQDDPEHQWNEDTRLDGIRADSPYARAKSEAEWVVRTAIVRGLDTIILNPAEVIGAWDHAMQWGRVVLAVAGDRLPFVPSGTGSFCSAREVGRAHVSALTRGAIGARYILAGTDAAYVDLIRQIALVTGVTPPLQEGQRLAREMQSSCASEEDSALRDPYCLQRLAGHYRFDSSRAVRDLGYRIVPLVDMVRDAYDWYRSHGFVAATRRGPRVGIMSPS